MIQRAIKLIIDYLGALILLIILTPFFILFGIMIKIDSPGPVFFKQERGGKNGKLFKILKFRTMVENAEKIGSGYKVTQNDQRITRLGKFLREWSIDEFPQLINILRGEMSFVGPRPALKYQIEKYNDFQKKRLLVKSGIVSSVDIWGGRKTLFWEERFKYDVWYVEHWSLWLDLKIIFLTPFVVFSRKGVYGKEGTDDPFL